MLEKKSSSVSSTSSESEVLLQIPPPSLTHHHHGLQELPEDGELDIGKLNLTLPRTGGGGGGGGGGSGSDVDIEEEENKSLNHHQKRRAHHQPHRKSKPNSCSFHSSDEIIDEEDLLLTISDTDNNDIPIIPGMISHSVTANTSDADFDSAFEDSLYSGSSDDKNIGKNKGDSGNCRASSSVLKNKSRKKSSTNHLTALNPGLERSHHQHPTAETGTTTQGHENIMEVIGHGEESNEECPQVQRRDHNPRGSGRTGNEMEYLNDYMGLGLEGTHQLEQNFPIHNEPEITLFEMEVSPGNRSQHDEIMPALHENNLLSRDCNDPFKAFDKNPLEGYEKISSRHVPFSHRRAYYDDTNEPDNLGRRGRTNFSDEEGSSGEPDNDAITQEGSEFDTILLAPPLDMEVQLSPMGSPTAGVERGMKVNLDVTLTSPETLQSATTPTACPPLQFPGGESDQVLAIISDPEVIKKQDGESSPQQGSLDGDIDPNPSSKPSSLAILLPTSPEGNNNQITTPTINPGTEENREQEFDVVYVVPDGGWGWMVLFGSILVNILIPGTVKSFGILFVEFLEVFNATPSAAAWIPALSYWLYSSMGPFAGALATKYSHRSITIVGGLLASVGLMLSYFATSISYLYISYGIIGGLGAGLAYPIGVFMVGQYFEKRRGLANGLCTSGSALGSVLVPPLLRVLLNEYGYRGAILIMGAILLNVCIAAMFYEPVSKHMKRVLVPRDKSAVIRSPEEEEINRLGLDTPRIESSRTIQPFPQRMVTNPIPSKVVQGPRREIAASMPIAIPMPQLTNIADFRDGISNRRSNSGRKATFQIGHEDDSWSYQSNEVASPLAARLVKEADPNSSGTGTVNSPSRWSFYNPGGGIRVRGHLPGIPINSSNPNNDSSNPELETLIHSNSGGALANVNTNPNPGATSLSLSAVGTSRGQSRLNLTAIPEDDDNDTNSENNSRQVDWSYYSGLPPAKQRLLRLSVVGGTQLMGSSGSGMGGCGTQSAHPSSGALVNQGQGQGHGLSRTLSVASNVSTSSFHYMSTIHHGSLLTAMQYDKHMPEFASTLTLKSVRHSCCPRLSTVKGILRKLTCGLWPSKSTPQQEQDEQDCRTGIMSRRDQQFDPETGAPLPSPKSKAKPSKSERFKKFIDLSLLKDGMYLIMLMSNSTTAVGYTNFIVLLPSYALAMGFDKSQAASLLSIVAALDFVGRIGGAALSDLQFISRRWYYIVGLFLSGVALSFLPYARTYSSLVTMCACFGLASGTYIGVTAVILADQLGAEKLGSSYGISLFLNGLLQLIGPPICGAVYQSTGKLEPILTGLGVTLILGALLWIFAPFIERRRRIKEEKLALLTMVPPGGGENGGKDTPPARIVQNSANAIILNRSDTSLV